jgi:Transposase domain (DUF772)
VGFNFMSVPWPWPLAAPLSYVIWEPFRAHFDPIIGRPSIPIETNLRLMFLKFRHRLGDEPLCREVADSISWQRFCRIPLGGQMPHPTTLVKLTRRLGEPRSWRSSSTTGLKGQCGPGFAMICAQRSTDSFRAVVVL